MKTPLQRLRGLAALKHDRKARKHQHTQPLFDEVAQADQDMQDIRDCYDRLLSAAAATANSAYEFSESLKDIGDCLLEKTAVSDFDDEESGKVLLMLGKVQLELQRLVDNYRSHIFQTITIPSESLLNELRVVEEMKRRCDDKREAYKDMLTKYREKGRLRSSKGESFSSQHLQVAQDEYDEEANALIFRMRSLKQGQCHSLLTQAIRHHASQLCFFRKAFKSLEAIEPHVKSVTEEQHIDYHFSGLEDDEDDNDDDDDDDDEDDDEDGSRADSELSFDYKQNNKRQDARLRNLLEENEGESPRCYSFSFRKDVKTNSKSAPLFPEKRIDTTDRRTDLRFFHSHKYVSYALPTPKEAKSPVYMTSNAEVPATRRASLGSLNLWHSSPLDQNKYEKLETNEKLSGPMLLDTKSVLREKNNNINRSPLPPPLLESLSSLQVDQNDKSDTKKIKRYAFSGPLTGKPWLNKPAVTVSSPIGSTGNPFLSGTRLQIPLPQPSPTPKLSSHASPTFISSPKISELHELPRPPPHLASRRPSTRIDYSVPLVSQGSQLSPTNKLMVSTGVSTFPMPPPVLPRSYSIPSRGEIDTTLHALKPLEAPRNVHMSEGIASPPLTPISLSNSRPASATS